MFNILIKLSTYYLNMHDIAMTNITRIFFVMAI